MNLYFEEQKEIALADLNLPRSIINALFQMNICTIEQLSNLTAAELENQSTQVGTKTIQKVRECLNTVGTDLLTDEQRFNSELDKFNWTRNFHPVSINIFSLGQLLSYSYAEIVELNIGRKFYPRTNIREIIYGIGLVLQEAKSDRVISSTFMQSWYLEFTIVDFNGISVETPQHNQIISPWVGIELIRSRPMRLTLQRWFVNTQDFLEFALVHNDYQLADKLRIDYDKVAPFRKAAEELSKTGMF